MNISGGEFDNMQKIACFPRKNCILFLLITLILCVSFSIRTGFCGGDLKKSKALDEKVRMFLENHKGTWHDWNVPYSDGKILCPSGVKSTFDSC